MLVLDAEHERGTVWNLDRVFRRLGLAAAELEQFLSQSLELRMIGLEASEIGGGICA